MGCIGYGSGKLLGCTEYGPGRSLGTLEQCAAILLVAIPPPEFCHSRYLLQDETSVTENHVDLHRNENGSRACREQFQTASY